MITNNYIICDIPFARVYGIESSIMLSELLNEYKYWEQKGELIGNKFYSTIKNIEERTTIKEYKQREILNKFKKLGILEVTLEGLPSKRFINFNFEVLNELVNSLINTDNYTENASNSNFDIQTQIPQNFKDSYPLKPQTKYINIKSNKYNNTINSVIKKNKQKNSSKSSSKLTLADSIVKSNKDNYNVVDNTINSFNGKFSNKVIDLVYDWCNSLAEYNDLAEVKGDIRKLTNKSLLVVLGKLSNLSELEQIVSIEKAIQNPRYGTIYPESFKQTNTRYNPDTAVNADTNIEQNNNFNNFEIGENGIERKRNT